MARLGSDKTSQTPLPGKKAAEERRTAVGYITPGLEEEWGAGVIFPTKAGEDAPICVTLSNHLLRHLVLLNHTFASPTR